MSRNECSDTECARCVTRSLEGLIIIIVQRFFTIDTTENLHLDRKYGIGAKTINQKDLILLRVEIDDRKSSKFLLLHFQTVFACPSQIIAHKTADMMV